MSKEKLVEEEKEEPQYNKNLSELEIAIAELRGQLRKEFEEGSFKMVEEIQKTTGEILAQIDKTMSVLTDRYIALQNFVDDLSYSMKK